MQVIIWLQPVAVLRLVLVLLLLDIHLRQITVEWLLDVFLKELVQIALPTVLLQKRQVLNQLQLVQMLWRVQILQLQ